MNHEAWSGGFKSRGPSLPSLARGLVFSPSKEQAGRFGRLGRGGAACRVLCAPFGVVRNQNKGRRGNQTRQNQPEREKKKL